MKLDEKLAAFLVFLLGSSSALAETESVEQLKKEIAVVKLDGMIRTAIGVTRNNTLIPAFIDEEDLDFGTEKTRILLVGGLNGKIESTRVILEALASFRSDSKNRERFVVSAVPCARPDHLGAEAVPFRVFPPEGQAYNQPENDIDHSLWRWIGMHAPDLVVEVRASGEQRRLENQKPRPDVSDVQDKVPFLGDLAAIGKRLPLEVALHLAAPSETGSIPALLAHVGDGDGLWLMESLETPPRGGDSIDDLLLEAQGLKAGSAPSPARLEVQRRIARSPIEVAKELAQVYGRKLDSIAYIPSLAVIGQMRLGDLTDDVDRVAAAEKLAEPYLTGEKNAIAKRVGGSQLSGHLIFSALARRTGNDSWVELARTAADYGFDENGEPKESMPFHNEMSDAVFMGCAILAEVGALTGEKKYFDQCLRHLKFMENRCLRDDGIYRHSPLDEAAWGRGNGFPALGMTLSLSALPEDSEAFAYFLKSYRNHLEALRTHQDATGMWHQVIDHPESYREFTATSMITFAIVRGIRRGWLEEKEWAPVVEKSWRAIKSRIGPNGRLVDVCTGTGKQKNLRAYFDRTAILGPDDRGGAMALMVSTEIAFREREKR